ncbi:MAG: protein YgfX [Pseudomonadales bacterium]
MPTNLNVRIIPSRYLLMLLLAITLLAIACICLSALPLVLQLIALVLVGSISTAVLRRHYFLSADDSILALRYRHDRWYLQLCDAELTATLLPASTLTNSLVVLNFLIDGSGKRANLVLLSDSAPADLLRKLKTALRFSQFRNNSPA